VVVVQQEYGWCMCNCQTEVRHLLEAFCRQPQGAQPGHIQPVLRAMCQLAAACANHAGASWLSWQPKLLAQLLRHLHQQRNQLEQHQVASILRDVGQLVVLHTLVVREAAAPTGTGAAAPGSPAPASSTAAPATAVPGAAAAAGDDEGTGQSGAEQQQEQQQQEQQQDQEASPAAAGAAALEPAAGAGDTESPAQPPESTAAPGGAGSSISSASATAGPHPPATSSSKGSTTTTTSSSSKDAAKQNPLDDMLLTVLKEVAAVAGPSDPPGTLLVLNLLRNQVAELGLLGQVQNLCEMLPLSFAGALPQATVLSRGPLAARAAGLVAAALAAGPAASAGSRLDKLLLALSLQRMRDVLAGGCAGLRLHEGEEWQLGVWC
jgi:hypothetical protein